MDTSQRGALNILLIPLILAVVFLFAALGFGAWAFSERQDYKNNVDKKIASAVTVAKQDQQKVDAAAYAEEAKKPYDTYIGPAAFGNVSVQYPKTWSAYIFEGNRGGTPLNTYFHPNHIRDVTDVDNAHALRIQVMQQSYDTVLGQYKNKVEQKEISSAPYSLPKVPSVVGVRLEGQIDQRKQGVMIILPLRNMTLRVWTESMDFKADFDTHILPNLTFQP